MKYIRYTLAAAALLTALSANGNDKSNTNREALIALENHWLNKEHKAAALDQILAADFLHPVVTGDVLSKAQHIKFASTPPASPDLTKRRSSGSRIWTLVLLTA
jgi:hypothetical protein